MRCARQKFQLFDLVTFAFVLAACGARLPHRRRLLLLRPRNLPRHPLPRKRPLPLRLSRASQSGLAYRHRSADRTRPRAWRSSRPWS